MYEDVEFEEGNVSRMQSAFGRKWQHWLDVSAPHVGPRWALASFIMLIYCVRVYLINGARRSPACGARLRRTPPAPPTCAPPADERLVHHNLRPWHLRAEPADWLSVAATRSRDRGAHVAADEG